MLPSRPLKLDPDFLLRIGLKTGAPMVVAIVTVGVVIWRHPLPDELVMLAMGVGLFVLGVIRSRPFWRYRGFAREGEEVEAEVVEVVEGSESLLPVGDIGRGAFRLRVGNIELLHEAWDADGWPLFLDAARKRALVLRHKRRLLIVRNDFHPFDFAPEEEQAIRGRIE